MPTYGRLQWEAPDVRCRCCKLSTVAAGVAWLSLIGSILGVVIGFMATIVGTVVSFQHDGATARTTYMVAGVVAGGCILFVYGIKLAVSSILLHGLYNEMPRLLTPWLVYSVIELGLYFLSWIIFLAVQPVKGMVPSTSFVAVCTFSFRGLLIFTVNRYRKQLKDRMPHATNDLPLLNSSEC